MSGADPQRLSSRTLDRLSAGIARPQYDRAAQKTGIVHFGIGAFHRAHQAVYTDDAMASGDRDWGITGVSLRSAGVQDQLVPQDGLYSLVERRPDGDAVRVIGAVGTVMVGGPDAVAIMDALASPDTHVLSFTITEKGYHRALGGDLDFDHPAIVADLAGGTPQTIYGFMRAAVERRRAAGLPGLSLVSCDNLAGNGAVLERCLTSFLDRADAPLARWFADECACPSTMVDRIVPATTEADLDVLANQLGAHDAAAVVTEPFRQWVIEDRFAGPRPRWEAGGAEFVGDVHGYEVAKLRLLNGAHSALAYLGLAAGHQFVHQAVGDPAIRATVDRLMAEATATLAAIPGFDVAAYRTRLIQRFENIRLPHNLSQIAMDGSQKLPQRWFATLSDAGRAGRQAPALLEALSAWITYIRGDRFQVADPQAAALADLWAQAGSAGIVDALFGAQGLFASTWTADPQSAAILKSRLNRR